MTVLKNLPKHIQNMDVFVTLSAAEQAELDRFNSQVANTLAQYRIQSATTRLSSWERELGLEVNESRSNEERRSIILSKVRGQGPCTVRLVETTAESFGIGQAEVVENFSAYTFVIEYNMDDLSETVNSQDMHNAISSIKPVHLGFDIYFIARKTIGVVPTYDILLFNDGLAYTLGQNQLGGGPF